MIKTLCDLCKRAEVDCPIYPQNTWHCREFQPSVGKIKQHVELQMYEQGTIKKALRGSKSNEI